VKAVILAGGLGTRLREETEYRPKPMVQIGDHPIMWHIMKTYAHHGVTDFVVCVGYRGDVIKEYFLNYEALSRDFTVRLGREHTTEVHGYSQEKDWSVTVAETGQDTMTGGRVKRAGRYVGEESFMVTYGDGLANVDVSALMAFHRAHGRLATMTCVQPSTRFGVVELDGAGAVQHFREKPRAIDWINGGYFVFEPQVLDRLDGDDTVLEQEPLEGLAADGELMAFRHEGFWQPMDTYREFQMLNDLWDRGEAPWAVWER